MADDIANLARAWGLSAGDVSLFADGHRQHAQGERMRETVFEAAERIREALRFRSGTPLAAFGRFVDEVRTVSRWSPRWPIA